MGDNKVSMPAAPKFKPDPNVAWSQDRLKEQYGYLMDGLTKEGQSLTGGLGEATNISPEISRLSMQYAQSQLDPRYRQQKQDMINTLEANNQLTGSTTASSLANMSNDYLSSLTGMQAQYGIADVNRALDNRVQLYTTGLNVGQNVGAAGLSNQNQMNQFALANYENQVAAAMANQDSGSWLGGAGTGAMVGGLAGALLAVPTGGLSIAAGGGLGMLLGGGAGAMMGGMGASNQSIASSGMQTAGMLGGIGSKTSPYAPNTYTSGREFTSGIGAYQPQYGGFNQSSYMPQGWGYQGGLR